MMTKGGAPNLLSGMAWSVTDMDGSQVFGVPSSHHPAKGPPKQTVLELLQAHNEAVHLEIR
jgi:hypothetical protein